MMQQSKSNHVMHSLWRNRGLLYQFTRRRIHLQNQGSLLGTFWQLLGPFLQMVLYTVVFGILRQNSFGVVDNESPMEFALGIFMGIIVFEMIGAILGISPHLIRENRNLVKKVVFPLEILPVSSVISQMYDFIISYGLYLVGLFFFGKGFSWGDFAVILVMIPLFAFCFGLGLILSSVGVYLRDIGNLIRYISLALFWSSGIFFAVAKVRDGAPEVYQYLKYNPILQMIDIFRCITLWHIPFSTNALIYVWVFSFLLLGIGFSVFKRLKKGFADVI